MRSPYCYNCRKVVVYTIHLRKGLYGKEHKFYECIECKKELGLYMTGPLKGIEIRFVITEKNE